MARLQERNGKPEMEALFLFQNYSTDSKLLYEGSQSFPVQVFFFKADFLYFEIITLLANKGSSVEYDSSFLTWIYLAFICSFIFAHFWE